MMTEKDLRKAIEQDRRTFIKNVLGGTIAGSLLLVIPAAGEQNFEEFPAMRGGTDVFTPKQFAFVVDITACIGCGACCVVDKAEYKVPDGHCRTWLERYIIDAEDNVYVDSPRFGSGGWDGNTRARATIPHPIRETFFVPKLCNMCEKPSCVQVCPAGATYKTTDGFILVDKTRCVGCASCIQACPYSARFIDPLTGTAEKCTWCCHRVREGLLPACVAVCPVHARKFGDLADRTSEVWRILHAPNAIPVLKPDMGRKTALHYVGLRREVV